MGMMVMGIQIARTLVLCLVCRDGAPFWRWKYEKIMAAEPSCVYPKPQPKLREALLLGDHRALNYGWGREVHPLFKEMRTLSED